MTFRAADTVWQLMSNAHTKMEITNETRTSEWKRMVITAYCVKWRQEPDGS